jgi:hypothetical protein
MLDEGEGVSEWMRVWAYQVPALEREGWRFSHALVGGASEQLYGPAYRDCWVVREVTDGETGKAG